MPNTAHALPPATRERGWSALGAFLLLFVPLFSLSVVWSLGNGVEQSVREGVRSAPFRIVLKFGMRRAQADDLTAEWSKRSEWRDFETVAPFALFAEVEELGDWASREENRDVLALMPYVIETTLAEPLPMGVIESLTNEMEKRPEVDRVVFDRPALRGYDHLWRAARAADAALSIIFVFLAIGGAAAIGRSGRGREGASFWRRRETVMVAAAVSGFAAVLAQSAVYLILRAWEPATAGFMLSFAQVLVLLAVGGMLGVGAVLGPGLLGRGAAAGLCLALLAPGGGAQARSALPDPGTPVVKPALPPVDGRDARLTAVAPIGNDTDSRRNRLAEVEAQIGETRQLIEYHGDVLDLDKRDREELKRNTELTRVRVDVLREEMQSLRLAAEGRRRRLESVAWATAMTHPDGETMVATGSDRRTRQSTAFHILALTLRQDAFMAQMDQRRLAELETTWRGLMREQARLLFFLKNEGLSRESVVSEKDRLQNQLVELLRERAILRDEPAPLAGEAAIETGSTAGTAKTEESVSLRLSSLFSGPAQPHLEGQYLFAQPGTLVRAVREGTVLYAGAFKGLGYVVIIDHGDGVSTVYSYLSSELSVEQGQKVQTGEYIGSAGMLKRHGVGGMRFEVRKDGVLAGIETLGVGAQDVENLLGGTKR